MDGVIATIMMFGGNFAPRTWALCGGQLLPIAQNSALFSLVGTIYGGDGRTDFALPDLRGRVPIGAGYGPGLSDYRLGARGGAEVITLNVTQIPSHSHSATTDDHKAQIMVGKEGLGAGPTTTAANNYLGNAADNMYRTAISNPTQTMASTAITFRPNFVTVNNTGGSMSHENRMPWLALNYIICMAGVFPSRS